MASFFIQNFGCRASQADGAAIDSLLTGKGLHGSSDLATSDIVILNTCTVTSAADHDLRYAVRRVQKDNPAARIVVTGCYAQRAPQEIAALPGVSLVVGNSHKSQIADLIADTTAPFHGEIHVGDIFAQQEFLASPVSEPGPDRSRPNLKIQDGCNNRCSFCVIPFVRGRSRSAPAAQVTDHIRELSKRYAEVVLTGINLGRWGREPGSQMRLVNLLRKVLSETEIQRLRLSSVEPMDFSDDLLALIAEQPRIARHVHAPLQSGSDTVLRRMHRKYRPRHYEDRVTKAREWMPDAAIGADVMVGFPGETDIEFQETVDFIEKLPFTYLHVFPYSERPGTPAAVREDQVQSEVRKERGRILKQIGLQKNLEFRRRMVGQKLSAAVLEKDTAAMTTNYLPVALAVPRPSRTICDVTIGGVTKNGVCEAGALPVFA